MRSGLRGIATGALALIALHTLVAPGASGRVSSLFGVPAKVARRFIDPTIPAIPDRRSDGDDDDQRLSQPAGQTPARRFPDPFQTGAPR